MATTTDILKFFSSPEQVQTLANFAHNIPGFILCITALLFLAAELGYQRQKLAIVYSTLFIIMPVVFSGYIFLSHGFANSLKIAAIISDYPEVYLHAFTLLGNLLGGIGELLYVRGKIRSPLGALCLPVLFLVDGYLSILHVHGAAGHHDLFHNFYGSMMVFTGLLIIIERLITENFRKYFLFFATLCMIISGVMLMSFKEPINAYSYAFPTANSTSTPIFMAKGDFVTVYISRMGAVPHDIQIHKGASVIFTQLDNSLHEIDSGPHPQHNQYPPLNIGTLLQGETRNVLFTKTGNLGYHDHINDTDIRFQGSIIVTQ